MKKNILIKPLVAVFALAMAITVNAQDVFKLEHFDELVASGKVEVILQKGEQAQAVVETNGLEESDININIHCVINFLLPIIIWLTKRKQTDHAKSKK